MKVFLYRSGVGTESSLLQQETALSVHTGTDLFAQLSASVKGALGWTGRRCPAY